MAESYISIRVILDKIMRHPLLLDITLETAVDYAIDFMRIVGMPQIFDEKTEVLTLSLYRASLPIDFYKMILVRGVVDDGTVVFRHSTDTFHMSSVKPDPTELTYKLQNSIIYTSIEEGDIEISYMAISLDTEGYPNIPDNSSFTRALELYIKKLWFTILFDLNKISPNVLLNTQQEYAWAVGDCQSEFNRLTLDKAESFYNSLKTLIIRDNQHREGFRSNGSKELIKLQ